MAVVGKDKELGTTKQPRSDAWLGWFVPLVIFLLTFAVFFPALRNGFVNWDDDGNLLENLNYRGLGWTRLRWMFTTFYMTLYRPLTWVTLGFDYLLWGMNPFGYHLTSLLLHAANAVLFYFVSLRLLRPALPGAAVSGELPLKVSAGFAALLFSLHPLRVEVAAWASAQSDLLSGLFFLGTILCYLRANVTPGGAARLRWMTAGVIIYGMSLLSKAVGMTLPVVLLVLDVYPLGRLGGGPGKWFGPAARRVWREKAPFFLLALGAGVMALLAKQKATYSFEELGALPRLAQALYGLSFYLWKTVMPLGLSPLYQLSVHLDPTDWLFLSSGLAALVVTIGLFVIRRRWPAGLACWVCYVAILSPVLGIAQSGPQIAADRYAYLSCLGWALLAGAGLLYCWRFWVSGRIGYGSFLATLAAAGMVLFVLAALTWTQTQVWHDSETLWRYALAVDQRSGYAHDNLGNALFERGELEEAIAHFRQALKINPAHAKAHNNFGNALLVRGEVEEAIEHYRQAAQMDPSNAKARNNLGVALARRGELKEAIDQFRQALMIDPDYAKAHRNLGNALAKQGELDEAIDHFRQAVRIQPEFAEAHESLSRALSQRGREEEAAQHFQEALRIMRFRHGSPP